MDPREGEGTSMGTSGEDEDLFGDDQEIEKVKEWWLQSELAESQGREIKEEEEEDEPEAAPVEEAIRAEPQGEPLAVAEFKDEKPTAGAQRDAGVGDTEALISSLKADLEKEDEEETNIVLKEAMEEFGNVSAAELLEMGMATLRELMEKTK